MRICSPQILALVFASLMAAVPAPAGPPTPTCETRGAYRHCFDHRGFLSTEQRTGD
jgi:hypothetical protein